LYYSKYISFFQFVSHNISEALKLSIRVLVMDAGVIQQYTAPREILENPSTDFVRQLAKWERRF